MWDSFTDRAAKGCGTGCGLVLGLMLGLAIASLVHHFTGWSPHL